MSRPDRSAYAIADRPVPNGRGLQYDGDKIADEFGGAGGYPILRRYVFGPGLVEGGGDEPLVWYEGAGTSDKRYLIADERGSIVAVSDNGANPIHINSYDESGIAAGTFDANGNLTGNANLGTFQYTGQAFIPEMGLYLYKARAYSPMLGRFMQPDPIGYADGINWYNYAHGDPVNNVDPSGLGNQCSAILCVSTSTSTPGSSGSSGGLPNLGPISLIIGLFDSIFGHHHHHSATQAPPPIAKAQPVPQKTNPVCTRRLPGGGTIGQNVATINNLANDLLKSPDPSGAGFGVLGYWFGKVAPGGDWAGRLGEPGGNQNYGATGRAAGIPLNILLRGAGAAEMLEGLTGRTGSGSTGQGNPLGGPPYGDNPEGQKQIKEGYNAGC